MSPDQRGMCFAEWKKCWAAIQETPAAGHVVDEKAARVAITRKAIGLEKSWGDAWSQKQVDWLLAVMWAITHSDNLTLQMRQIDQPLTRMEGSEFAQTFLDAIRDAARATGDLQLAERLDNTGGRESYVNGISQRIHKKPLCDLDDEQWQDVLAALNHTRLHKLGIKHQHPRSPWQARKGQKPAGRDAASPSHPSPASQPESRTGAPAFGQDDGEPF